MKRSQVIQHIANRLDGLMVHTRHIADDEAEHLLVELESMGMLPPPRRVRSPDDPKLPSFTVYKWSPEDET